MSLEGYCLCSVRFGQIRFCKYRAVLPTHKTIGAAPWTYGTCPCILKRMSPSTPCPGRWCLPVIFFRGGEGTKIPWCFFYTSCINLCSKSIHDLGKWFVWSYQNQNCVIFIADNNSWSMIASSRKLIFFAAPSNSLLLSDKKKIITLNDTIAPNGKRTFPSKATFVYGVDFSL